MRSNEDRDRRKLIMTADDFGVSLEVNDAIVLACRSGVLRFTSLMVAEPAAADAVERSKKECPGLGIGLHLVLCNGQSVLGKSKIPELVDEHGRFPDDPVKCGMRYFFNFGLRKALELEMRAQFERFLDLGLAPSHVDGHINIHVHPVIFPMLVRLSKEYGFKRMRLPGGEFRISMTYSLRPFWKQAKETFIFTLLRAYLLKAYADPGIEIPDRTLGLLRSGVMKEDYVSHCVQSLPPGTSEIYFHPSSDPSSKIDAHPNLTHRNITELQTLLSSELRAAMSLSGMELLGAG